MQNLELLGIIGKVKQHQLVFMLDSGASCNFISQDLFATLNLDRYVVKNSSTVRLANGGIVQTVGKAIIRVKFGKFQYFGPFYILNCEVPLILGMEFFSKVRPQVDWGERIVSIQQGQRLTRLQTVNISKKVQQNALETTGNDEIVDNNSFGDLQIEDLECSDVAHSSCFEKVDVQQSARSRDVMEIRNCRHCTRVMPPGNTDLVCKKCKNHSFQHLQGSLVANERSCVSAKNVGEGIHSQLVDHSSQLVENGSKLVDIDGNLHPKQCNSVEIVPLKQFVRGGKHKMYLNFGCIQLHDLVDDDVADQQLYFTHRTSHGGDGDSSSDHGVMQQLAKQQLDMLKSKYPEVFCEPVYPVDRSDCPVVFEHKIPLKDPTAAPPKRKLYPLDNTELVELKAQIKQFLESNRIEPANGPYGAPILFAKKKDGGLRMCIDYRMLNQQVVGDAFPLPRIDELLQRLDGCVIFSKLDLRDGYHQIPMYEQDKVKTSFTCRYGTYQFTVMPFGLSNAPSTFQRMMNRIFFDLLDEGVLCYLDDLLIYSKSVAQHQVVLDKVFQLLSRHKLYIKESKCHLFLEKVNFLGHVVTKDGVSLEQGKVQAVEKWPQPENVNQIQQFLGLCNYYRRFVLRFSEIAGPLSLLTRKDQPFVFGPDQLRAFQQLKYNLCNAPVLKVFDPSLQTRVVCDASNFCVGAVLEQCHESKWHPVEYYSKRLSSAERNYSATDREFVAIKLSLERWRQFLIGIKFVLLTDHAALTYLQSTATVSRRNARWLEFLSQFDFDIFHIKGKENVVADSLSRIPGSESLEMLQLCNLVNSFGILHVDDTPARLQKQFGNIHQQCNSFLTIHENESFLQSILQEQQSSTNQWYLDKVELCKSGNTTWQYRDGILCKLVNDVFCPVIPSPDSRSVQVILHDLHSSALSGHFGLKKLLKLAMSRFYWKQMYKSVEAFCKRCPVCQANKTSTQRPIGKLQPVENPSKPFSHVTMDFVMPLPVSTRGYDAIFTIVDRFSRLVRFIPCNSTLTAADTARLFFEHWVCRFGMPDKIVCDRDTRFQSTFWQQLTQLLDCRVAMSTAYHPQTDGLSERYHRSVEQILRCYCSSQQEHWCTYLSQCEFALNSSVQDSTGHIPFETIYGCVPKLPIDNNVGVLQPPSVVDFVGNRNTIQQQVRGNLASAQLRMKSLADSSRRQSEFQVGSQVWLSTAHLPLRLGARKLAAKWCGPYRVCAIIAPEALQLELPAQFRIHPVFHSSQLKLAVGTPGRPAPIQLSEDQSEEFEVQEILATRKVRGQEYFLVRWKGYTAFDDTWEPLGNLGNSQRLLRQFRQKQMHP